MKKVKGAKTVYFIDLNDDRAYTLQDLYRDWKTFSTEDPENHAPNFKTELFEILMATINGRNDLEIIGMTSREVSNYIINLRKLIEERIARLIPEN